MERPFDRIVPIAALFALLAAAILIGWTGFTASDDSLYYTGAIHWLDAPPFPGDNHWSTRFPLVLSFAAVLASLGRGFAAFGTTALAWYAVLVTTAGLFARRQGGDRAGWIAALLVGTMPVIIANATTVSIDPLEASALLGGAWLLGAAPRDAGGRWQGLLAGCCFGMAVLGRETAILSIAGLGVLFLIGRPVRRETLIAASVGLALVLGAEALFQYAMTGMPFRRYDIAFHHDSHIDRAANLEGNFLLHPAIDPLLVLLVNDDFGLLFWAAIAAVALGGRGLRTGLPTPMLVLGAMAIADFLLVGALTHKLVLNPRYFTVPAIFAAMLVALWLAQASSKVRWGVTAGLVLINFAFLSVSNHHPRWEVEALVDACVQHRGETVAADPVTVRRAAIPLRFALADNARQGAAIPGGLALVPAKDVGELSIVARYPSPPTIAGVVVRSLGLAPLVPQAIARRLFSPSPDYVLVRAPAH